ncbi:umecyanin-like [Juglans microcarpa x Juglans regia]|uniref:umecyanin-like n=1 Tax=Juglans microcarpa x Juglans regia TaxID=2249226 RepID=UPI001B7DA666|nr:umecyanin-like [Juglans microcarpa x Juglans regia]
MDYSMGRRHLFIMDCLVLIMVALNIIEAATAATTFEVGGSLGWTVPPNTSYYATWASSKTFAVGDTLEFKWNSTHNVLEVMTKAEYDGCTKTNGPIWETSPVVTTVTAGTRYFICSIGSHCASGQKLAVTSVASANAPPTPPGSSASSFPTASVVLPAILATMAISLIFVI